MQYIKKQNTAPRDWDSWFSKGDGSGAVYRSYIYEQAHPQLKAYLHDEQGGLCAYCQATISQSNSTVEHILPQSLNNELSTNYHNLVLVCAGTTAGEKHCDKARGNQWILPLILSNKAGQHTDDGKDELKILELMNSQSFNALNSKSNRYFKAHEDGRISAKSANEPYLEQQVTFFIEILNLNHKDLKEKREKAINALNDVYRTLPIAKNKATRKQFFEKQFFAIFRDKSRQFRQFLLLYTKQQF